MVSMGVFRYRFTMLQGGGEEIISVYALFIYCRSFEYSPSFVFTVSDEQRHTVSILWFSQGGENSPPWFSQAFLLNYNQNRPYKSFLLGFEFTLTYSVISWIH